MIKNEEDKRKETARAAARVVEMLENEGWHLMVCRDCEDGHITGRRLPEDLTGLLARLLAAMARDATVLTGLRKRGFVAHLSGYELRAYADGRLELAGEREGLLAAADVGKPAGPLEETAYAILRDRLLESLRVFV